MRYYQRSKQQHKYRQLDAFNTHASPLHRNSVIGNLCQSCYNGLDISPVERAALDDQDDEP
jgi:hypothetical protein